MGMFLVTENLELYSRHDPTECAARVRAALQAKPVATSSPAEILFSPIIEGFVEGDSIYLCHRSGADSSRPTFCAATMQPFETGTLIRGRFRVGRPERFFRNISLTLLYAFGTLTVSFSLYGAACGETTNRWVALCAPLIFLMLTIVLSVWVRWLTCPRPVYLAAFLRSALDCPLEPGERDS